MGFGVYEDFWKVSDVFFGIFFVSICFVWSLVIFFWLFFLSFKCWYNLIKIMVRISLEEISGGNVILKGG